ncbi:hypothetical protein OAD01_03125 [Candidatus Marinimicrobia bacterium]|nr:hypothetical protein [Candidatus Neomarinimicrobiota bacterium]
MNDNIKVSIGFLIPASAIILFIASLYAENFLLSAFISILGLLAWFLYSTVMQTKMPSVTGNIIILFGVLLSLAIFLSFGMKRNMFGGYEFVPEGGAASAILLLIIALLGLLFKKNLDYSAIRTDSSLEAPAQKKPSIKKPAKPKNNEVSTVKSYYEPEYEEDDEYDEDEEGYEEDEGYESYEEDEDWDYEE